MGVKCSHLLCVYISDLMGIRCAALYLESSQQTNSERNSMYVMCSHLLSVSGVYIIDPTD